MKLLAEISDHSLNIGPAEEIGGTYTLRKSARALLFNEHGQIAIQHIARDGFHKLPGGGVDGNESIHEALLREIKEEVGCTCVVSDKVGCIIEYREKYQLIHLAFCFVAKIIGPMGEPTLEQAEIDEKMETLWMDPKDAYVLIASEHPEVYNGKFINMREKTFLEEYLQLPQR